MRRFGAASLDLAWTAAGRVDGYWERGLGPWDIAAGVLLVTEAGGMVSGIDGNQIDIRAGTVCAANLELNPQIVRMLKLAG